MITATILSLSASAALAQISPTPISVNGQDGGGDHGR